MAVTFLTNEDGKRFVKTINNMQPDENGNVKITVGNSDVDLSGYATKDELPTKVSELENDSGYLTEHQDITGKLDVSELPIAINTALAQAKASGEFDGQDGYSPSVTVMDIDGGHRMTITDKDGVKTFDIMNGKDGSDGNGGTGGSDISAIESYILNIDYNAILAFDTSEVIFGINTSSVLGQAILGQMILA